MDFAWDEKEEDLRADIRAFLDEHLNSDLEDRLYRTGVSHDESFARAMGAKNWIGADWARDGFEPLDVFGVHVLTDELTKADAPVYLVSTSMMVARVIRAVGSEELQADILPQGGTR